MSHSIKQVKKDKWQIFGHKHESIVQSYIVIEDDYCRISIIGGNPKQKKDVRCELDKSSVIRGYLSYIMYAIRKLNDMEKKLDKTG